MHTNKAVENLIFVEVAINRKSCQQLLVFRQNSMSDIVFDFSYIASRLEHKTWLLLHLDHLSFYRFLENRILNCEPLHEQFLFTNLLRLFERQRPSVSKTIFDRVLPLDDLKCFRSDLFGRLACHWNFDELRLDVAKKRSNIFIENFIY